MSIEHIEFLVEEPSMEAFLVEILPRIFGDRPTFTIHAYQGKNDLLAKVESRLRGYAKWLPESARIVILLDRDDDNCIELKQKIENAAMAANLPSRKTIRSQPNNQTAWRIVSRIAVEELESWFFGNWSAVRRAYPRLPANAVNKAAYRECDAIAGGTWEALERIMRKSGYFSGGLRKVEVAQRIGRHFDPLACSSPSFAVLRTALVEATN